jgi:hypothetical protein
VQSQDGISSCIRKLAGYGRGSFLRLIHGASRSLSPAQTKASYVPMK